MGAVVLRRACLFPPVKAIIKAMPTVSERFHKGVGAGLLPASEATSPETRPQLTALRRKHKTRLDKARWSWGWEALQGTGGGASFPGPGRRENAWAPVKYWAPLLGPNPRLDAIANGPELRIQGRGKPYLARGGRIRERVWAAGGRGFLPIAGGGTFRHLCVAVRASHAPTTQPPGCGG